jgi:aspartyl-tRNA(Asn)/glutamyl-tRNA(Gln) amidotransferase subunit A
MGSSVEDAATLYCRLAGADPADAATAGLPSESPQWDLSRGVRGLRVGVDEEFIQAADSDVAAGVRRAVEALVEQGAVRVEVTLPHKQHLRTVAWITLLAEAAAAQEKVLRDRIEMVGPDVRLWLLAGSRVTAAEYLKAQRVRAMIQAEMGALLSTVDVLVLPTTACTAPRLHADAVTGEVDDTVNEQLTRYTALANLVGAPAVSVPTAPAGDGMPVGVQILGRAFEEEKVMRAAWAVEQWSLPLQGRPKVWFDVMP